MSAWPSSPDAYPHTSIRGYTDGLRAHHAPLQDALDSNARLEAQVSQLQGELALAQRELQGTRDGERQARHSAQHDGLTQLPNRQYFEACLHDALAQHHSTGRALALFFLDLDDFKLVNDTHGHAAGDVLLRVVAARLNQAIRKDDVVCRLGGDEFACLLPGLGQHQQLKQLAAKLFDSVAAPCQIAACHVSVRPSIGIAVCPEHGVSGPELLAHADTAMYRAKREHTGYAFFDAEA